MTELSIPELSLVVLIGSTGSGKSTFARKHFPQTAVVSSDACRGIVSDDENDQSATPDAFALLHHIAGIRLRRGLRTVIDATNVQPRARQELVAVARAHDVLPVAIVLDVPDAVCLRRNALRPDRSHLAAHVVHRQQRELRRGLRGLEREGFRKVYVLRGTEEIEGATLVDEKAWNDKRELTGPFDVIGDVHGCRAELETLLGELGYALERDEAGRAVGARHPHGRTAVFVGDLVDRGPDTPGVLRLVMGMVAAGTALCVTGNHEHKLVRALDGKKVKVAHGLAESLSQLEAEDEDFRKATLDFCRGLISHYVLDGGNLVVAHAGLKEEYQGRASGRVRAFAMYGESTGETDEYGFPVRYPWASDYRGRATVLYGHTPVTELRWVNNTLCLDTGVVFGGRLTALRYPEREPVSVPAEQVWYEPVRPLAPAVATTADTTAAVVHRDPGVLDLDDVLGRRVVHTRHHGRVGVQEENAGAALEVMSRFAIDPRWLVYLPPTMAPCATSSLDGYLEHPAEAFAYYRSEGVGRVVCEEKHMGSRAVVLVTRSAAVARDRFGVEDDGTGAIYTRTGRPFFDDPAQTEWLLARVRAAAEAAGLFEDLRSEWLLLDTELLPWSAKAVALLRNQYAAVGAAATAALGDTAAVLAAVAARGQDVTELAERTAGRRADAAAFTTAYGRYCWTTDGLAGLRLAPFQLLAAEGVNHATRDHAWHLAVIDRLVAADPELFTPTRRMVVDLADADAEAAATAWWIELTTAGGEGMVVKPFDSLVRSRSVDRPCTDGERGLEGPGSAPDTSETTDTPPREQSARLVQPGVKCRGPEYLRIIYGPEYLREPNLRRLRTRGLGRKRSMALREYALGLEALDRFVAGEPLWRVHEAVFAVLALESEPVDPRL
ncbi:polynucleotide kinase-phosphatase [Nocardia amikacinitolerans]|uniref:polynucleotide kinase-phosphatase n=1 Tax=Nocardia amikacinitolerans TaxID=756689 RepID=UPI0020A5D734|nr:polynucleotide kinase-phosphatase [Nocardia amikacinitolerans]MCP2278600.1 polynucleotide kinase-phosphatase [Nocardia amikacinitolerans]